MNHRPCPADEPWLPRWWWRSLAAGLGVVFAVLLIAFALIT